ASGGVTSNPPSLAGEGGARAERRGRVGAWLGKCGAGVSPRPPEAAAILLGGDDREQHLAEPLDRRRAGLLEGRGDPGALQLRQAPFQLAADLGQLQEALAAVLDAAMLDDKALAQQLA